MKLRTATSCKKKKVIKKNYNIIKFIYCGSLECENVIIKLINDFEKKKIVQKNILLELTIIYNNENNKLFDLIQNKSENIIFKNNITNNINLCYEITKSHIAIFNEYSIDYKNYDIFIIKNIENLYFLQDIFNKYLISDHIYIINVEKLDNVEEVISLESYSNNDENSSLFINIDGTRLDESYILLKKNYITPNFINKNFKFMEIYGSSLNKIFINKEYFSKINMEKNYCLDEIINESYYLNKNIFNNKIAFIGDVFTYNSFNNIIELIYISKENINIDPEDFDFLICESTWHGIDNTWEFAFNLFNEKKYSKELIKIINLFKKNNKKCIFYNKEDPTNYNSFYSVASLFDIIITTSQKCVNNYEKLYPNKIIYAYPFCCNPIKNNPIRHKNKEIINQALFVGGFYNHLTNRTEETNKLFDSVLEKYDLKIINRHYFFPKFTKQVFKFKRNRNKYEISDKYEKYNYPPIDSRNVYNLYKYYKILLNVNTVTDCETMCSRRLIELLACGCNIFSNKSLSINNLNLFVITNLNELINSDLENLNINGFLQTHLYFSYITFIEKIYKILNLELFENIKYKILCKNEKYIDPNYKKYIYENNYEFLLHLNKENQYYDNELIKKIVIHLYFYNENIGFTNNKSQFYKIYDYEDNYDIIISCNIKKNILLIPNYILLNNFIN